VSILHSDRARARLESVIWWRLIALAGLGVVALPAQAAQHRDAGTLTVRLISHTSAGKVITDLPPKNKNSKGDVLVVEATLRNAVRQFGRAKGAVVGRDTVVFTFRSPTAVDVIVESKLPGGSLRAAGRTQLGYRLSYALTAGEGRFAKARGTGESVALGEQGHRRLNVYRLVLP
jgi:hypothetical protein